MTVDAQASGLAPGYRALWAGESVGGLTDTQLLGRFVEARGEASELAFAALVRRHGPMVLKVARDVLGDDHSAEDVFQATFLVLARKARSIARPESLGPWLHGVARRVSRKARVEADRRRRRETVAAGRSPGWFEPGPTGAWEALHEEIARLPGLGRLAVVLCYFEGLSHEEAARRIGVTEATVRGRLARARRQLRNRLNARGPCSLGSLPMVPGRWIGPTARAASRFARCGTWESPARAAGLAEGVLRMMAISPFQLATWLAIPAMLAVAVAASLARPQDPRSSESESPIRVQAEVAQAVIPGPVIPTVEPIRISLSFEQAVERLLNEDGALRSKFFEIPSARTDILTAGLRANPVFYADVQLVPYGRYATRRPIGAAQYDVNVSRPPDSTKKRRARVAAAVRPANVVEAQYVDAVRMKIDGLARAFTEALEARDLASQCHESIERLERLCDVSARIGLDPGSLDQARDDADRAWREADRRLDARLRRMATFLAIGAEDAGRLAVLGDLGRAPALPALESLNRDALASRPDLAAHRLGLDRARADAGLAPAELLPPIGGDQPPAPAPGVRDRIFLNAWRSQLELGGRERAILDEVKEARRQATEAARLLDDADERSVVARFAFETAATRFEKGTKPLPAVLEAAKAAEESERTRIEALARVRQSRVALNTVIGRRDF